MTKPRLKTQINENLNINIEEKFDYEIIDVKLKAYD